MKRTVTPELLDTDSGTASEIEDSLADLRGINRRFGGIATTQAMVERVARRTGAQSLSLLEVGAGAGYVPTAVRDRLSGRIGIDVTLLDRVASHLRNGKPPVAPAVVGDAVALPFSDNSFDLVSCGLFAHHLSPPEIVQFVREGLRVCRKAVLINDLIRNPIHLGLVYAAYPLYRSRLTKHDAPASVRAAYTPWEMRELIAQTAAVRVEISRHYLFRMALVVWKQHV